MTYFLLLTIPTETLYQNTKILSNWESILSYLLFGFAIMALSYSVTPLFDVPKNGADLAILLTVVGSLCNQLMGMRYF